jgi:hypothetical protein
MTARFCGLDGKWDVIYDPVTGVGHVQRTGDAEARPVRFTMRGTAVRFGSTVPPDVSREVQRWIDRGAPGASAPRSA